MHYKDLLHNRYGALVVIEKTENIGRNAAWICKCDCGNEIISIGSNLRRGYITSCGCSKKETLKKVRRKLEPGQANLNVLFYHYNKTANNRNLQFDIPIEKFETLTQESCYYCGVEPAQIKDVSSNGQYVYNGLDRLDNIKGYTLDNVVPCCGVCNLAKRKMTVAQFDSWIKRVYKHRFIKLSEKTPAFIIDELFTTLMKLWLAQEDIMKSEKETPEALAAAKKAQELNARRNKLMRTIDELLGFQEDTLTEKTYA